MAAARYWRVVGITPSAGTDVEVAGVQLWASGARVDAGATVTANQAPVSGSVADLQGTAGTRVRFAPGSSVLVWSWDFGSSTTVEEIRVRGGDDSAAWPGALTVEYAASADGPWAAGFSSGWVAYPGAGGWGVSADPDFLRTQFLIRPSGSNIVDAGPFNSTVGFTTNGAQVSVSSTQAKFGSTSIFVNGGSCIRMSGGACGLADFRIDMQVFVPTTANPLNRDLVMGLIYESNGFNGTDGGIRLRLSSSATAVAPYFHTSNGSGWTSRISSSISAERGAWNHIELSRTAGVARLWVNGTLAGSADISTFSVVTPVLFFGGNNYDSSGFATAFLDEIRFSVGPGNTSAFTPPTSRYPVNGTPHPLPFRQPAVTRFDGGMPSAIVGTAQPAAPLPFDVEDFGPGSIVGTVKRKGTPFNLPLARRVRLVHQRSGRVIRETWSDAATGNYAFANVKMGDPYCVMAFDHEGNFRGVVADNVLAVVS